MTTNILRLFFVISLLNAQLYAARKDVNSSTVQSIQQSASVDITNMERFWDGGSILIKLNFNNGPSTSLLFKRAQGGRKLAGVVLFPKTDEILANKDEIDVKVGSSLEQKLKILLKKYCKDNSGSKYARGALIAIGFLEDRNRIWDDGEWISAIPQKN